MTAEQRRAEDARSVRADRQPGAGDTEALPRQVERQEWQHECSEAVDEGPAEEHPCGTGHRADLGEHCLAMSYWIRDSRTCTPSDSEALDKACGRGFPNH